MYLLCCTCYHCSPFTLEHNHSQLALELELDDKAIHTSYKLNTPTS